MNTAFESIIDVFESGDWSAADRLLRVIVPASEREARLARAHGEIVRSMQAQVAGEVLRARALLSDAAELFSPRMRQPAPGGRYRAVLLPAPPPEQCWDTIVWRTARVVLREQAGLDERQEPLRRERITTRDAFVAAAQEHLRWVDSVALRGAREAGIAIDGSSRDLAWRATQLCRLSDERSPTLTTDALRRAGGWAWVEHLALVDLADRELVPSTGPGALPAHVPPRQGRVEAHRRACQHVADLEC